MLWQVALLLASDDISTIAHRDQNNCMAHTENTAVAVAVPVVDNGEMYASDQHSRSLPRSFDEIFITYMLCIEYTWFTIKLRHNYATRRRSAQVIQRCRRARTLYSEQRHSHRLCLLSVVWVRCHDGTRTTFHHPCIFHAIWIELIIKYYHKCMWASVCPRTQCDRTTNNGRPRAKIGILIFIWSTRDTLIDIESRISSVWCLRMPSSNTNNEKIDIN